ncbi:hypothetical protein Tco_0057963 [Tanacetum coccineum]
MEKRGKDKSRQSPSVKKSTKVNPKIQRPQSTRPRTTSVVIRDVEEEPRRATSVSIIHNQDKEVAQRLFEEEQALFEREQRFIYLPWIKASITWAGCAFDIAEFEDVQARMDADALKEEKLYEKEQKWIKDFIPMDSEEGGKKAASSKKRPRAEPDEESVKRLKIGEASGSGEEQSAKKENYLSR